MPANFPYGFSCISSRTRYTHRMRIGMVSILVVVWLVQAAAAAGPGLLVVGYARITQAQTAGVEPSDRIIAYGDISVNTYAELSHAVKSNQADEVTLTISRHSQTIELNVHQGPLGLYVRGKHDAPTPDCYETMAEVMGVENNSQAAKLDIRKGDRVYRYGTLHVDSARRLVNAVKTNEQPRTTLYFFRDGNPMSVTVNKGHIGIILKNTIVPCPGLRV